MKKKIELSARMKAVARMVTPGSRVCDVGCDHGYVSLYLLQQGISPCVIAMDINRGPLLRARENVLAAGMEQYIELRQSDGLTACQPGEADSLVIAGMGGKLMSRILKQDPEKTASFKELILQPQSQVGEFRAFLRKAGYSITDENMIIEGEKFYPMMRAVPGKGTSAHKQEALLYLEDRFGPRLLAQRNPVLQLYLKREWEKANLLKSRLASAGTGLGAKKRLQELSEEMRLLSQAAQLMEMEDFYGNDIR